MSRAFVVGSFALVSLVACGSPSAVEDGAGAAAAGHGTTNATNETDGSGASGAGDTGSAGTGDLPCDVDQVLQSHCRSCHGSVPSGGAKTSLMTHADLVAPSIADPAQSEGAMSLARMKAATMPPAPTSPVPAAEITAFEAWVGAGMPTGDCGSEGTGGAGGGGDSPYDTPVQCSSNTYWTQGDKGFADMHPGLACDGCHKLFGKASGKTFDVAGTVYPTAHEPDDCNGGTTGATVVITDASGKDTVLDVRSSGNFYREDFFGFAALPVPLKAKVVFNGKERAMTAAVPTGDCNSCHTEAGTTDAPGRIMLP